MDTVIEAATINEIWEQVEADLKEPESPVNYHTSIHYESRVIDLFIDIDFGGGFEGGFEYTAITTPVVIQSTGLRTELTSTNEFRFALHHEGFMDKIGKFFGMEDVVIGYPEFDKALIVKTNDTDRIKQIFQQKELRDFFEKSRNFSIHITDGHGNTKNRMLELEFDRAITDVNELKEMFTVFYAVAREIEGH